MSTDLSLEQAIQALRNGDRETARDLLHQLTQANPLKPEGWLWLAAAQDDPIQKRVCLQQVIALDPGNQHALAGLRALEQQGAASTPPGAGLEPTAGAPPAQTSAPASRLAPPRFVSTGRRARRVSWSIVAVVAALVILIPLALWLLGQAQAAQAFAGAWTIALWMQRADRADD